MERKRVLLVEDEPELIKIVETVFKDEGFDVRMALSAENALEIVKTFTPSIVISDVKMEGMDGFDFVEALRKNPMYQKTPVILVTILDDRDSIERAKKLGVSAYMTKPFDADELLEKVRELIGS